MIIHVVNSGEVLWQIAEYYQTNINAIIEVNGLLNPNLLLRGQALFIPITNILYTVRYGDTLWNIANRHGVSLLELLNLNRIINPDLVFPGVVLTIPQEPRPSIEVNAYTYVFGSNDISILQSIMDYLTYLKPFAYLVQVDGRLSSINDEQSIQLAISNNAMPIMSISNFSYNNGDSELAHIILNSIELINTLLDNIINTMINKGYRGLNVYFEDLLPQDREAYNNFLQMAAGALNAEGFFISITLPPKYSDEQNTMYEAYDYEAIGRIVDYVLLKTYDWDLEEGSQMAISPISEIRRVLDYVVFVIPRDKIFMGVQLYARDWIIPHIQGRQAETISMQEAMNRAYRYRVQIQYDEVSQSPFFHYTDSQGRLHEVWFEDARSVQVKFDTVKDYNLRGLSYWTLGYPFPQNWYLLEDNFIIIKE